MHIRDIDLEVKMWYFAAVDPITNTLKSSESFVNVAA